MKKLIEKLVGTRSYFRLEIVTTALNMIFGAVVVGAVLFLLEQSVAVYLDRMTRTLIPIGAGFVVASMALNAMAIGIFWFIRYQSVVEHRGSVTQINILSWYRYFCIYTLIKVGLVLFWKLWEASPLPTTPDGAAFVIVTAFSIYSYYLSLKTEEQLRSREGAGSLSGDQSH